MTGGKLSVLEFLGFGAPAMKSAALSPVSVAPPPARKTARVEDPAGAAPDPS